MLINLIGALGLFLIGMWLMTEGLKMAGGSALKNLLGHWTSSRLRGLASGTLITALVQSSGAVTIAAIGFVNTQLMSFQQALWVVFGSNVGTTFTAWIVTFLGFSFSIENLTAPLIGVGAGLRIFAPNDRGRALGMALAGFGLLFMGIDSLKLTFADYAAQIDVSALLQSYPSPILIAAIIGLVLTVLTQSSSASIAIILTAVATDIVDLNVAAAGVIGANIGSTSTAILAAMGATPNAKRLAVAHIAFNLVTASVAFMILPVFLLLLDSLLEDIHAQANSVVLIALFHTSFNLLGVLLMWPLEPPLSRWLSTRFTQSKARAGVHIDANIATIPDLAIGAVSLELKDILSAAGKLNFHTGNPSGPPDPRANKLLAHLEEVDAFIEQTLKSGLTGNQGNQLSTSLAVSHYLQNACHTYVQASQRLSELMPGTPLNALTEWLRALNLLSGTLSHEDADLRREELDQLAQNYRLLKQQVISAVVNERIAIARVDDTLQAASLCRRFIEQLMQAADNHDLLNAETLTADNNAESSPIPS